MKQKFTTLKDVKPGDIVVHRLVCHDVVSNSSFSEQQIMLVLASVYVPGDVAEFGGWTLSGVTGTKAHAQEGTFVTALKMGRKIVSGKQHSSASRFAVAYELEDQAVNSFFIMASDSSWVPFSRENAELLRKERQ